MLHEETTHQHRTIVVPGTLTPTTEEEKQQAIIALQEPSKVVAFQCNSIILNAWNAELEQCVEVGDVNEVRWGLIFFSTSGPEEQLAHTPSAMTVLAVLRFFER